MKTRVQFLSSGLRISGELYTPDQAAEGRLPAIVIGHPGSGVKEQAAGLYAQRLGELGFVTLAFDAAYQGESEGLPRGREIPSQRIEDIKAAVSFLATLESVASDKIGVLGICASGGYSIAAAAADHRIRSVATVSGVDMGDQFRYGADGTQDVRILQAMLDQAASARNREAQANGSLSFPIFPASEESARSMGVHVFEGWEYYCTDRAGHPRSAKEFTWESIDQIATFEAFRFVEMISPRPMLMVVGTEAVTSWMSTNAFQRAREPKELMWVPGASHVDLYDREVYVAPTIEKLGQFYQKTLG